MLSYLVFLLSYFLSTPVNIIFHEFGHAISALIFTKSMVHIDLCDGVTGKLIDFTIGRLRLTFSWQNLFYHSGLTIHAPVKSLTASRIIILSGVVLSLNKA
uniref:Peptidase_M50B family protein n=1 Tax=Leptospira interrogans serovar Canicola TaxID=211880 RepID=A0A067YD78_LEPIR|nr:peptidase M50 [Leptospira interrogans]AGZ84963.1 Peptidase_M50B family protein [Leptospira interrogans serovar Canicola]